MPGMNGTGPGGEGPRTGWNRGRCRPPKKEPEDETQVETDDGQPTDDIQPAQGRGQGGGGRGRGGQGGGRRRRMRRGFGGGGVQS